MNQNIQTRVKRGTRIWVVRKDNTLDQVVYTVQRVARTGGKLISVVHDNWAELPVENYEVVR